MLRFGFDSEFLNIKTFGTLSCQSKILNSYQLEKYSLTTTRGSVKQSTVKTFWWKKYCRTNSKPSTVSAKQSTVNTSDSQSIQKCLIFIQSELNEANALIEKGKEMLSNKEKDILQVCSNYKLCVINYCILYIVQALLNYFYKSKFYSNKVVKGREEATLSCFIKQNYKVK